MLVLRNYLSWAFVVNGLPFAPTPTITTSLDHYHQALTSISSIDNSNIISDRYNVNPSSSISNGINLLSLLPEEQKKQQNNNIKLERDEIERLIDANTIKLKKNGVVRLAYVRMPSVTTSSSGNTFQLPACFTYSPSYKIRQLVPSKTIVNIYKIYNNDSNNSPPRVILIRNKDSLIVNEELVKTGFAKVITTTSRKNINNNIESSSSSSSLLDMEILLELQKKAQRNGLGIWSTCDDATNINDATKIKLVEAEFEPLENTMETIYTPDGGYQKVRVLDNGKRKTPKNPGDTKGCSDFNNYEEALEWYEYYYQYYGDVAKLDRDRDGVPCPGLPHTSVRERYRMKIPSKN